MRCGEVFCSFVMSCHDGIRECSSDRYVNYFCHGDIVKCQAKRSARSRVPASRVEAG
jgi:hypothetical protein